MNLQEALSADSRVQTDDRNARTACMACTRINTSRSLVFHKRIQWHDSKISLHLHT